MIISTIKNAYLGNSTTVYVPEKITQIGNYTFYKCSGLKNIILHNKLTDIGDNAFNECTILEAITIPDSVTTIGKEAFKQCSKLASIKLSNSITNINSNTFEYCTSLTNIDLPNSLETIGEYVFDHCTKLTSLKIPDAVTSIGNNAINYCSKLTSITIGKSINTFNENIITNCPKITAITVSPDNIIYDSRDNCNAIIDTANNELIFACTNTTIPSTVTTIGSYAYRNVSLKTITIPENITYLKKYSLVPYTTSMIWPLQEIIIDGSPKMEDVFGLSDNYENYAVKSTLRKLKSITIKGTVPESNPFSYNLVSSNVSTLTSFNVQLKVKKQYLSDFQNKFCCPFFKDTDNIITYDETITPSTLILNSNEEKSVLLAGKIDSSIFNVHDSSGSYSGGELFAKTTDIILSNEVTAIDHNFTGTSSYIPAVKDITIPNTIESIGCYFLQRAVNIQKLVLPESITKIGIGLLLNNGYGTTLSNNITISLNSTTPPQFINTNDEIITSDNSITSSTLWPRIIYNSAINYRICVPAESIDKYKSALGWSLYQDIIYANNYYTFTNSSILKNIISDYNTITDLINWYNEYTGMVWDDNITELCTSAFDGCEKLEAIDLPNTITTIGQYAFNNCSSLESIKIPDSVTNIKACAFSNCKSLKAVTIGTGITNLETSLFDSIDNKLEIFINATVPPTITDLTFPTNIVIKVPLAVVDTYKNTWTQYADNIIGYNYYTFAYDSRVYNIISSYADITTFTDWSETHNGYTGFRWGDGITFINTYAFQLCSSLTDIVLPDTVKIIGLCAFLQCTNLTNITLSKNLKIIGAYAFQKCTSLVTITIPASVTIIYSYAITYCSSLTTIIMESTTPPSLATGTFINNTSLTAIKVPSSAVDTYKSATGWSAYASLIIGY